jgi:hypothetical protein
MHSSTDLSCSPHACASRASAQIALAQTFNYTLKVLYLGCLWKALSIDKYPADRFEIHPVSVTTSFGANRAAAGQAADEARW